MHCKIRHKIPAMAAILIQVILPCQDTGISRLCDWNIQGANTHHHCLRVKSKVNFICNESKQNGLPAMAANPIICLAKMRITSTVTLPSSTSTMVANTDWECVALPLCEAMPTTRIQTRNLETKPSKIIIDNINISTQIGRMNSYSKSLKQRCFTTNLYL